jgi:hypothetical protein
MIKHALLLFIIAALSACTIVQVQGADPSTSVHFGVLRLDPAPGARSVSYRIRGVGLVPSLNGATLGIAREDVVLAYHPEDCRIVLFDWPTEPTLRQLLADRLSSSTICQPGSAR